MKKTKNHTKDKLKELKHEWKQAHTSVTKLDIESYAEIEPEVIEWLWQDKIPKEGITMFVGDPESFKSTTSLYVAAQVSQGRCFPNCDTPTERGTVLIIGSEDSHSAVVKPRLMAAQADLTKIKHIKGRMKIDTITRKSKDSYIIDLIAEIELLEKEIKQTPDFRLLIVDTLSSYLGSRKINSMEDTRDFLDRLSELSYKYHFAVLIIHHFNKNEEASSQYRGSGSTGIRAGVRAQWAFVVDKYTDGRAFMLRDKLNITAVKTGLAFHMEEKELNLQGKSAWIGYCVFEDEVITDDLEAFLGRKHKRSAPKRCEAEEWLRNHLADQKEHDSKTVIEAAKEQNISEVTLRRAATKMNVCIEAVRNGNQFKQWMWKLS